jgi:hypothetical protein
VSASSATSALEKLPVLPGLGQEPRAKERDVRRLNLLNIIMQSAYHAAGPFGILESGDTCPRSLSGDSVANDARPAEQV